MKRPLSHLFSLIAAIASVFTAIILILSGYGGLVDPTTSAIPAILAMAFPIFLGVTLLLMVLNAIWWRRLLIVNTLSLIVCYSPIAAWCPFHHSKVVVPEGHESFTLLTYNVMGLLNYADSASTTPVNPTLSFIMKVDPDVVALQEFSSIHYSDGKRIEPAQTDSVKTIYPYRAVSNAQVGLLSKFPIRQLDVHITPMSSYLVEAYTIDLPGNDSVTVINVHLQSIGLTSADRELYVNMTDGIPHRSEIREAKKDLLGKLGRAYKLRAQQAREVRALVDSIPGNVVVCGDFNDIPLCYAQRTIMGNDMKDAYIQLGEGPGISFHADRLYFRIDHILYRGNVVPVAIQRLISNNSDHYPMLATFIYPE